MATFPSPRDLVNAVADHFRHLYLPYEGAHFRAAFAMDNGPRFLTASAVFRGPHKPSRPVQNYGTVLLVEEWVRGQDEALAKLSQLVSGQGTIEGESIPGTFSNTHPERLTYVSTRGWIGWRYVSRMDRSPNWTEFRLQQGPLLSPGLRPYLSAADAVSRWVSDTPSANSPTVVDQECIVTMLPDLRARITSAEWRPGLVRIEIKLGVPADHVELQLLYADSEREYAIQSGVKEQMEIDVPGDARLVYLYLLHTSGECICELNLRSQYSGSGKAQKTIDAQQQCISDLDDGETDTVEYKPFMKPQSAKETEFVETVIAFANTSGGNIYVGVQDDGSPQGEAAVRASFHCEAEAALEVQADRLKTLAREKIKPVPHIVVNRLTIHDHPLIVARVERGSQCPYSTHENKVFVRKGATNRIADPHTELTALIQRPTIR
jgi:hypothetical protein